MPLRDAGQTAYTPIPTSAPTSSSGPNVADIGRKSRLDDFVSALGLATGDPDAQLRMSQDGKTVHVLVPSSKSAVPSLWVRFKSALSGLPLLNRSATLRGARMEVESHRMEQEGVNVIVGLVQREEAAFERLHAGVNLDRQYSNHVRKQLECDGASLTKRRVQEVLDNTRTALGRYGATLILERSRASQQGIAAPAAAPPPMVRGRNEPLTHAQKLQLEGTPVFPMKKEAATAAHRPSAAASPHRHKELMAECTKAAREQTESSNPRDIQANAAALYDKARDFLKSKGRWPTPSPDDVALAVMQVR